MTIKSKLPKGARAIKPVKKKVGNWLEMIYDAEVERYGLTWLRVQNGMGGEGLREDWVCVLPSRCVSIHDYQWDKKKKWGSDFYGSFDKAIIGRMKHGLESLKHAKAEMVANLTSCEMGIRALTEAIATVTDS